MGNLKWFYDLKKTARPQRQEVLEGVEWFSGDGKEQVIITENNKEYAFDIINKDLPLVSIDGREEINDKDLLGEDYERLRKRALEGWCEIKQLQSEGLEAA